MLSASSALIHALTIKNDFKKKMQIVKQKR